MMDHCVTVLHGLYKGQCPVGCVEAFHGGGAADSSLSIGGAWRMTHQSKLVCARSWCRTVQPRDCSERSWPIFNLSPRQKLNLPSDAFGLNAIRGNYSFPSSDWSTISEAGICLRLGFDALLEFSGTCLTRQNLELPIRNCVEDS